MAVVASVEVVAAAAAAAVVVVVVVVWCSSKIPRPDVFYSTASRTGGGQDASHSYSLERTGHVVVENRVIIRKPTSYHVQENRRLGEPLY